MADWWQEGQLYPAWGTHSGDFGGLGHLWHRGAWPDILNRRPWSSTSQPWVLLRLCWDMWRGRLSFPWDVSQRISGHAADWAQWLQALWSSILEANRVARLHALLQEDPCLHAWAGLYHLLTCSSSCTSKLSAPYWLWQERSQNILRQPHRLPLSLLSMDFSPLRCTYIAGTTKTQQDGLA